MIKQILEFFGIKPEIQVVEKIVEKDSDFGMPEIVRNITGEISSRGKETDWLQVYRQNGLIYACVNAIADAVSRVELHLMRYKGDEDQEVFESPLLDLLYKVNDFSTKADFFKLIVIHRKLCGNCFIWKSVQVGNEPKELWILRPDRVKIKTGKERPIMGYVFTLPDGQEMTFPFEDIIWLRMSDPVDPFIGRGIGTIQPSAVAIDTDIESQKFNYNFFANSAQPGGVLKTEQILNDADYKRLKQRWYERYGGTQNAHKTAILEKGLEFQIITPSPKEMDFANLRKWSRDEILSFFRVPKSILGIVEDVNRANAEASEYTFQKNVVEPEINAIIDQLNEYLVPIYGDDLYITYDSPVPQNRESTLAGYTNGINNGWLTPNEIRGQEGLPEVENGDQAYLPQNLMPLGQSAPVQPVKSHRIRVKKVDADLKKSVYDLINSLTPKNDVISDNKLHEYYWTKFVKDYGSYENQIKGVLNKYFENQEEFIVEKLKYKQYSPLTKAANDFKISIPKEVEIGINLLKPILGDLIDEQAKKAIEYIGDNFVFNTTEALEKYLNKNTKKFLKSVNETTQEKIKVALTEGFKNNESLRELTKRVKDVFQEATTSRAEMIAQTEVSKASNFAAEEAFIESEVVEGKQWFTAVDERVCEFCGPLDGQVWNLGEKVFKKGDSFTGKDGGSMSFDYSAIQDPPLHPNCRCTILPVFSTKKARLIPKGRLNEEADKMIKRIEKAGEEVKDKLSGEVKDIKEAANLIKEALQDDEEGEVKKAPKEVERAKGTKTADKKDNSNERKES